MDVLVIGGSGFIGTRLLTELKQQNHSVANLDLAPSAVHGDVTVTGDVRDVTAVTEALRGKDVVINLAAEHRDDVRPRERYWSVNVEGARSLVEAATAAGVSRVVFTSTVAVYGLARPHPDEDSPLEPFNDYGVTKKEAEQVLLEWACATRDRSVTIVRPCVVFGEANRGNVFNLAAQLAGHRFLMVGDGTNRKSMAYVGNIVAFLATLLDNPPGVHVVNYADKPDLQAREVVTTIRAGLGRKPLRFALPKAAGMTLGRGADVAAAVLRRPLPFSAVRVEKFCAETTIDTKRLEATGFVPPFTLRQGLERMLQAEFRQ